MERSSWDRFLGDLMRSSGLLDEQATGSLSCALRDATGHIA
ncbi:hypothetical protein [Streptomyces bungoensis]|nr:hypothetical protein [Streptomyces bungoensis]